MVGFQLVKVLDNSIIIMHVIVPPNGHQGPGRYSVSIKWYSELC